MGGGGNVTRQSLPQRRCNITDNAEWIAPDGSSHAFAVCIGFDDAGQAAEVFCNHAKGAMAATLADACVLISVALQHGITPDALGKSLGRAPSWQGDTPASPIGTIIETIRGATE
jgi:hypothetical protein